MDEYLQYGFYVRGFRRALTARQMSDRRVIRWIKNETARWGIPYAEIPERCINFLRDEPVIFIRKRTRDGKWVEAPLPTHKVFSCDVHWFEDFCVEVSMDQLPRLPRPEAKLRVWVLGTIVRAIRHKRLFG